MLILQLQVPSSELIRAGYAMNLVLNLLNLGVGLGNCVPFIKLKQKLYHNTFLILLHKPITYSTCVAKDDNILQ